MVNWCSSHRGQISDSIRYVVTVQSSIVDSYKRCVVVSLVQKPRLDKVSHPLHSGVRHRKKNAFDFESVRKVSVAKDTLGKFVKSLVDEGHQIRL
jgi:hypothetical protein